MGSEYGTRKSVRRVPRPRKPFCRTAAADIPNSQASPTTISVYRMLTVKA